MDSIKKAQRIGLLVMGLGGLLLVGGTYASIQDSSSFFFWISIFGWVIGVLGAVVYGYGLFRFMFRKKNGTG